MRSGETQLIFHQANKFFVARSVSTSSLFFRWARADNKFIDDDYFKLFVDLAESHQ